ncbi:sulfatase [Flavisolibacter sp. BT320]|nr:sulfatase [Flavisolibacter longurius]
MKKRKPFFLLLLVFIFCHIAVAQQKHSATKPSAKRSATGKRMNVLFIAVDDLRPELSAYGARHAITPNMDKLASTGALFNKAYCQYPVCAPSRASLMTGTRPNSTKVFGLYTDFRVALPNIQSLPQLFKDNGFFTNRFGKIFHVDDVQSWSVDYPAEKFGPAAVQPRAPYANVALNEAGWKKFEEGKKAGLIGSALERTQRGPAYEITDLPDDSLTDGKIALESIKALQQLRLAEKPFFLAVGFNKPHLPFVAPKKYWDLYESENIQVAQNKTPPENAPYALGPLEEFYTYTDVPQLRPVPDDYARKMRHGYYACVSFVDAQVGRVLNELERLGLAENTIVVLWGDHGFKLGEHGGWGKASNFELDVRVPLMVRVPGFPTNSEVNGLVELIDIYPTLAELAGIPIPAHVEGKSFVPLLKKSNTKGKPAAYTQCIRGSRTGYSIRTDRYRLVCWVKEGEKEVLELYDHRNDPEENLNLADKPNKLKIQANLLKQLKKEINVVNIRQEKTDS